MLDLVIGEVLIVNSDLTILVKVTHIGTHNKFRYNNFETILINEDKTGIRVHYLVGRRIKCYIRYRDAYNRLFSDIMLE